MYDLFMFNIKEIHQLISIFDVRPFTYNIKHCNVNNEVSYFNIPILDIKTQIYFCKNIIIYCIKYVFILFLNNLPANYIFMYN